MNDKAAFAVLISSYDGIGLAVILRVGFSAKLGDSGGMICLVKTTNLARLTYLKSLLASDDIPFMVFDEHISALEAGIGAFPRRLMVPDEFEAVAKRLLTDVDENYDD